MEETIQKIHKHAMPIMWTGVVDVLMILATFSFSKAAIVIHSIGNFTITLFSIFLAVPILLHVFDTLNPEKFKPYFHALFGTFCICALIWQVILGIITKTLNIFGWRSQSILNAKNLHKVSGIMVVILMKIQVYYKLKLEKEPVYLIIDIILIAFYLYRKFVTSKLTYKTLDIDESNLVSVNNLKALKN